VGHDPDVPDAIQRDVRLCNLGAQVVLSAVYQR
jgi:hypothetical protein